jgi:RHS repeat-associated protein
MVEVNGKPILYSPLGKIGRLNTGGSYIYAAIPTVAGRLDYITTSTYTRVEHPDWLARFMSNPHLNTAIGAVAYAPFGESYNKTSAMRLNFTDQFQDSQIADTYDFEARKLSDIQGRWLSPDPAGLAAVDLTNPQTWNRYAYVGNRPLNNIDRLGLFLNVCDASCEGDGGGGDDGGDGGDPCFFNPELCGGASPPPVAPPPDGGDSGGGKKPPKPPDINKTWTKTFQCNQSAEQVMTAVQNDMGWFADNRDWIFATNFPTQPISMGNQYTITPGLTNHVGSVEPGMIPTARLVVTVTSESANSWTFTTDPSHHYFDGTVSFSSTNAANGNVTFSVTANANYSNLFYKYALSPVIEAGESSTWNNMLNNVESYCQLPIGSS